MPGAASCAAVAQPPAWLSGRSGGQQQQRKREPGSSKAAPSQVGGDCGDGAQPATLPLGLPRPRTPRSSSSAGSSTPRASHDGSHRAGPEAPTTNSAPAGRASSQPAKQLTLMELVNQAARREELAEAARKASSPSSTPKISSRSMSGAAAPSLFASSSSSSRDVLAAGRQPSSAAAGRPPVSASSPSAPLHHHLSSSSGGNAPGGGGASTPRSAAAAGGVHRVAGGVPLTVGSSKPPLSPMSASAHARQHAPTNASVFAPFANASAASSTAAAAHKGPLAQLPVGAAAAAVGSDCASDDGCLTPEASLCSSASSSSLCSYGSLASSSCSTASRPKSILMRRSHSSSSGGGSASGSSSPGAPKQVRWRDGESVREDAGTDLVAVLLLHDTPEIRRMRKDTWPERGSKARDAAAASAPTVTIPAKLVSASSSTSSTSSSSSSSAAEGGGAASSSGNPLVATVMDWKEKLRALSAERRAQRVEALQATWTARQEQQQQQVREVQQEQAAAPAASLPVPAAASDSDGAPAAAAAAAAVDQSTEQQQQQQEVLKPLASVAGAAAVVAAGPVINLQAIAAGASISQACC